MRSEKFVVPLNKIPAAMLTRASTILFVPAEFKLVVSAKYLIIND